MVEILYNLSRKAIISSLCLIFEDQMKHSFFSYHSNWPFSFIPSCSIIVSLQLELQDLFRNNTLSIMKHKAQPSITAHMFSTMFYTSSYLQKRENW